LRLFNCGAARHLSRRAKFVFVITIRCLPKRLRQRLCPFTDQMAWRKARLAKYVQGNAAGGENVMTIVSRALLRFPSRQDDQSDTHRMLPPPAATRESLAAAAPSFPTPSALHGATLGPRGQDVVRCHSTWGFKAAPPMQPPSCGRRRLCDRRSFRAARSHSIATLRSGISISAQLRAPPKRNFIPRPCNV
jgi:hypothetical protein